MLLRIFKKPKYKIYYVDPNNNPKIELILILEKKDILKYGLSDFSFNTIIDDITYPEGYEIYLFSNLEEDVQKINKIYMDKIKDEIKLF